MPLENFAIGDSLLEVAPAHVSDAQAGEMLHRHFGLSGTLEKLGGERDLNFRVLLPDGASRLLKLSHPLENPDVVDFHNQAMRCIALRDPALPVQRVHTSLAGDHFVRVEVNGQRMLARLLSFVDGMQLHRVGRTTQAFRRSLGASLARLDVALEAFDHPAARHTLLWDMQHAAHLRPLLAHLEPGQGRALVEQSLDQFEAQVVPTMAGLRRQVIHNDMNPHNIIVDADNPDILRNILDFGDMVHAPLINEVAVAASYHLGHDGDALAPALDVIAAYHQHNPLAREELQLLPELLRTRLASALCINSWRAQLHPENRAYIHRNSQRAWASLASIAALPRAEIENRILAACSREGRA
ncbi:phosphotransferase [Pseudomonas sp. NBRC 111119]|uniref:phosphotransferase n=1 Tax=Pseudomonas sp. NBRC 111119 TaxID=1661034 RepID=UPI000761BE9D|nr:phosphotransferase [Pseudomonas sp. NBRC 111119]